MSLRLSLPFQKLLVIFSLFFTDALQLQAQFTPMRTTISTPYGKVPITTHDYSPNFNRWMWNRNRNNQGGGAEHTFMIVFSDSTEQEIKGKIMIDSPAHYIQWVDKSVGKKDSGRIKKIYPSQTLYIVRMDQNTSDLRGDKTDSCWLFRSVRGIIGVYTPFPEEKELMDDSKILYIQKRDGHLLKMNETNLEEMIKDNEKAYEFFKKKKYLKAINKYNDSF